MAEDSATAIADAPGRPGSRSILTRPINRWLIVLGCALVNMTASGIFVLYAINIFFVDALRDFGWSKSTTSLLMSVFFVSAGLGFPILGSIISRYGIRIPSIAFALVYGLALLSLPFLPPSKPIFIFAFFLMGIFSASACAMPFSIAISGYFDRDRGLALGLGAAGAGLGSALIAGVSNLLLEQVGWRQGLLVFSGFSIALILFCLTFLVRTPPSAVRSATQSSTAQSGPTFRELIDRELIIILSVLVINAVCATGIIGNIVPLLSGRGISTAMAASMLSVAGLSSWMGRVVVGWLLDRFFAPYVASVTFLLGVIGALLLIYAEWIPLSFLGAAMIGICMGAEQDLAMYLVSRYFPLSAYSKAVSVSWLAWAWGNGVGSFIAAQSYNLTGDYAVAFWIFILLFASAIALVLRLPAYRFQGHQDPHASN